jgi:hypothetical protein
MQRKVASTSAKSSKLVSKVQMENDKGRDREGRGREQSTVWVDNEMLKWLSLLLCFVELNQASLTY